MTRDEAMRAAAWAAAVGPREPAEAAHDAKVATAGADAELARVVEWLRKVGGSGPEALAAAIEAHAHWKEPTDG